MTQDEVATSERLSQSLRQAMVDNQIRTYDVTDQRLLEAFYKIPRERFLPAHLQTLAYSDAPITLTSSVAGQDDRVLSPPLVLAKLLQGAVPAATDKALVVGSATGYTAALLAEVTASVVALDADPAASGLARQHAAASANGRIEVVTGPLPKGHAAGAPYDVIVVDGGVDGKLDALFDQLAPGGRLVAIVTISDIGDRRVGRAMRFDKIAGEISERPLFDATVPVLSEFRADPAFVF